MTKGSPSADDVTGQTAALSRAEETIGGFLKRHRQSQGKDLDEVAEKTRIHASTLRAIEEGNPKALPAEVFVRGFIKNYARYLGLDPNDALAWYIKQNKGDARTTEKINVREVLAGEALAEARTFPVWRFIVFFLVAALIFFVGYFIFGFANSVAPSLGIFIKDEKPPALVGQQPSPTVPLTGDSGAEPVVVDMGVEQAPPVTQGGTQDSALSLSGKAGQLVEPQKVEGEQSLEVKKKQTKLSP
ncbi:MAG: helix-turn-helix domain-containing protein [Desulfurivibrionaceae bacterium]